MSEYFRLRVVVVAVCGLALLPQPSSDAHAATQPRASAIMGYTLAESSLDGGGFENVIAADPRHNGVVISGSDVAGLQRSADFGETWLPAQGGSITQADHTVAAIAFDSTSPNDVYAATDGGVVESIDDGRTWSPLPSPSDPNFSFNGSNSSNPNATTSAERCVGNLLAFDDSAKPHRIYAASFDDGVWLFNGSAWTQVVTQAALDGAFCNTSLAWGPGGTLDVATWGEGVFTINHPGGVATIQQVAGAPPAVQELVGLSDGNVWGAAYTTGVGVITKSVWTTSFSAGTERYMSIAGYVKGSADVVVAGSDNSQVNSGTLRAVLHETTNSGASWTSLPSSLGQVSSDLLGPPTPGDAWWHASYQPAMIYSLSMVPSSIAIEHESTGDDLWEAGYGGNWRLLGAEGQSTFYPSDLGTGSTVNHQIALDPTTANQPRTGQQLYLGDTDWGMFTSDDGLSTQQGISDDQFTGGGTDGFDTVVDGSPSPPVVYMGGGNRDTNSQGEIFSATAPATSVSAFQPLGLAPASGGGRPLALGVVDTSGTPTVIVAVDGSGMWTRVGAGPWQQDTSLFTAAQQPTAAIATGSGDTVYAYDRTVGVYRSTEAGAPNSWTLIWKHASLAAVPFLMIDSSDLSRLWVSAAGGLYSLAGADTGTSPTVTQVIAGATSGLGELNGQIFTTELGTGALELEVSDPTGATFMEMGNLAALATASSLAVAADGIVYIATAGSGVIVGTPEYTTTTALTSTPDPSKVGARVTFTATVTAGGEAPTGQVAFFNGNTKLGTAALNAAGVATYPSTKLKKGGHSITAKYAGDDGPSTSNAVVQKVN